MYIYVIYVHLKLVKRIKVASLVVEDLRHADGMYSVSEVVHRC